MPMLRIGATRTHIFRGGEKDGAPLSFSLGYLSTELRLQHQPPTPAELEGAIELIEESVMPLARLVSPAMGLVTDDAFAAHLLGLARRTTPSGGGELTLAEVEGSFNDMADVSQGRPSAGSPYLDKGLCGYLLILREFMHHLAFQEIAVVDPAASP